MVSMIWFGVLALAVARNDGVAALRESVDLDDAKDGTFA